MLLFLFLQLVLFTTLCLRSVASRNVSYDSRSMMLDGERIFILSGSIHYQRIHPSDWLRVLSLASEAGLNTIQAYVFWNQHEVEQGVVDFSMNNNITAFIQIAASVSLNVVVRIGPYACGEHFAGGE